MPKRSVLRIAICSIALLVAGCGGEGSPDSTEPVAEAEESLTGATIKAVCTDEESTDADLVVAKTDVARALTPLASGILFDPTYGVPAITGTGALAETCGLLVASEPAERGKLGAEPITRRDPALDSRWVLSQGGDANKFFAQLRADRPAPAAGEPDLVAQCLRAVSEVVADCSEVGVPSVIRPRVIALGNPDSMSWSCSR